MRGKNISKLSKSAFQNKIDKDLIIAGKNSVIELIPKYFRDIEFVVVPNASNSNKIIEVVDLCKKYDIDLVFSSEIIKYIEDMQIDSSGVVAILNKKIGSFLSLNDVVLHVEKSDYCTVVSFCNVDYEQNMGAMIRTSLAFDVDFILVSNSQRKVFSSTVTKVSMGYNHLIPIVRENFFLAIERLKDLGFDIVGLDTTGENIATAKYGHKVCFIVGNEGKGLSETVLRKCSKVLSIPMNNMVESLNVSVSLGIALYDRSLKINDAQRKI